MTVDELEDLAVLLAGGPLYRWQKRLLSDWFAKGTAPTTVDVPTGLGKTKVIALWLAAFASGVDLPRRLVYVVDRRAVVDQATTEAESVSKNLSRFLSDENRPIDVRRAVGERLGLELGESLPISTLRGAHVDNRRWSDRVSSAAVVVGTVDMIGSRLLFSGYGVSARMRPVHAGLLGCDTLFAIDESHLVPPFEALLRGVVRFRESSGSVDPAPRALVMALSATSAARDESSTFRLDASDREDAPVRRRLMAEKRLFLGPEVGAKELAEGLAERALEYGAEGRRVVIFCNSRKDALKVHDVIESRTRKLTPRPYLELLVGERRLRERELAAREGGDPTAVSALYPRFAPGAELGRGEAAYLVATSAGEVGVDLDADDCVCDLVAWERMVQRFGRVNRRADPGTSRVFVIPAAQDDSDAEDTIESQRLATLRAPFVSASWPRGEDGSLDASPAGLDIVKSAIPDVILEATTSRPLHPTLSAAVVDAWSMTQLRDHPGRPIVAPWLRGWIEQRPQTSIVWRRHFPLGRSPLDDRKEALDELSRFFEAAPPHMTEILEAPTDRVARWLKACFEEHDGEPDTDDADAPLHHPLAVVLDGRLEAQEILFKNVVSVRSILQLTRLLANATLVVDARIGGLAESGLLDEKVAAEPPTIDDASWELDLGSTVQRRVRFGTYESLTETWRPEGYRWTADPEVESPLTLWVELWRGEGWSVGDAAVLRFQQALAVHHGIAKSEVLAIAAMLGVASDRAETLGYAAAMHDAGKDRERWQEAMNAPRLGRPFAKLKGGSSPAMLAGYRHEFGSLSGIASDEGLRELATDDERDIALHLVAAHHGRARPTIAAVDPDRAPSLSAELAREVALRYVHLQQRIGAWDLAWWETVLKSADWRASKREEAS